MALFIAQRVPVGKVFGAMHGRLGMLVAKKVPAVNPPPPPGEITLPDYWKSFPALGGGYVGPLMGQMFLAVGHGAYIEGSSLKIGGAVLIGAAGKVFAFSSFGAANSWMMISQARAISEVELAQSMTPEARAAWLLKKREALEKAARNRINAAARVSDAGIKAALIADADFALAKWGHYP